MIITTLIALFTITQSKNATFEKFNSSHRLRNDSVFGNPSIFYSLEYFIISIVNRSIVFRFTVAIAAL
jgi:hypothetical protein